MSIKQMAKLKPMSKQRSEVYNIFREYSMSGNMTQVPMSVLLNIPCDIVHNLFTEPETEFFIDSVYKYYRNSGFPYYSISDEKIIQEHIF